ncbi:MAG TPA: hypothetical protein VL551_08755 [Actinospica sp.]|nr:hypothetical protein [Actinospica sp.]
MSDPFRQLVDLLPPPAGSIAAPPWQEIGDEIDVPLPSDYKWFSATYGGGRVTPAWSEDRRHPWLEIFSPSRSGHDGGPGGLRGLTDYHARHFHDGFTYDGSDEDMWAGAPRPVYPEPGGVLAWGMSEWGDSLFWLTEDPDPDSWPVVAWMRHLGEPVYPGCGLVEFLIRLFRSDFPPMSTWASPGLHWTIHNDWLRTGLDVAFG